ncbi:xanthine dehydrogenase molybdopterin binding subunit, partial [Burkholderia multivorans]
TSQTAFRGFGGPQGMLVMEDILGRIAPQLGLSARELLRRNFYQAGQDTPYYQPVRHPDRMEACWDEVVTSAEVAEREAEIARFNATHDHVKRG